MAVIKAKFSLLQVQIKSVPWHAIELRQAAFGITPKALDAVNVNTAPGELVVAMVDPQVLVKTHIDQAVIAAPAVGVNHAGDVGLASDNGLQDGFGGIGNNFRVNVLTSLEQPEHDRLLTRSSPPKPAYPAWSEIGFIGFELTAQRRNQFAMLGKPAAHAQVNAVDRAHRYATEFGAIRRCQIHRKIAQDLSKLGFTDL